MRKVFSATFVGNSVSIVLMMNVCRYECCVCVYENAWRNEYQNVV